MCVEPIGKDAYVRCLSPTVTWFNMQSHFASRALSLEQLFADPFLFDAPVYQRPFAWTVDEAGRLLDDLLAAHEGGEEAGSLLGSDYFIGAILLDDPMQTQAMPAGWPWTGTARAFNVVDGQQRLVTLTILFCVLRDLIAARSPATAFALSKCIRGEAAAQSAASERTRVRLRGQENAFLADNVQRRGACQETTPNDGLTPAQQRILDVREHFQSELAERDPIDLSGFAKFLLDHCTVVAITTRNIDRAHRMFTVLNNTGKDLARSDILKAELLGAIDPAIAGSYVAFWDETAARLDADFEPLFSHIRTVQGKAGGAIIAATRQLIADAGGAVPFIDNVMRPAARVLSQVTGCQHNGAPQSAEISQSLRYLSWLQGSEWVPVLIAGWLRNENDPAALLAFIKELDAQGYGMRILGLGADKRAQRLAPVLAAIRAGGSLQKAADAMAFSKDDLRAISKNLRDLHMRNPTTCKLVLLRINDYLSERPEHADPAAMTVEHVLPLKPAHASLWRVWYPNADERTQCAASLGNLTLVSRAQNEKARNLDFEVKLPIYFPPGNSVSPRILEEFRGRNEWRPEDVRQREANMFEAINRLWRFGPLSRRAAKAEES